MEKKIYILFSVLVTACCVSQSLPAKCNLRIDNEHWIKKFAATNSIDEQLTLIKDKIIADTLFPTYVDPDLNCDYKIHFQVNYANRKGLAVVLNDSLATTFLPKINSLNTSKIDIVSIPNWTRGFYCADPTPLPRTTVVFIEIRDREIRRELKKINAGK